MSDDVIRALREFRAAVAEPDAAEVIAAWERVRSGQPLRVAPQPRRFRVRRGRVVVAFSAAALVLAAAAGAVAYRLAGSSPGFTAGFSAFSSLPSASWPSTMPRVALERAAAYMGVTPEEFESRLRLVRSDAPRDIDANKTAQVYAYVAADGTACMFLSGEGGRCIDKRDAPAFPGVLPEIFPEYAGEPRILVALVADNVTNATLRHVGARDLELQIDNNSIVAPLEASDADTAQPYELVIDYADGTRHVMPLP
jgi:hypothetical protein